MDDISLFRVFYVLIVFCAGGTGNLLTYHNFKIILWPFCAVTQQQILFKLLENDVVLHPESITTVAKASDVFTEVQCISNRTAPRQWFLSPEHLALHSPLDPIQTSFDPGNGILRVFSSFIGDHAPRNGVITFQCSTNTTTSSVSLRLCKQPLNSHRYLFIQ